MPHLMPLILSVQKLNKRAFGNSREISKTWEISGKRIPIHIFKAVCPIVSYHKNGHKPLVVRNLTGPSHHDSVLFSSTTRSTSILCAVKLHLCSKWSKIQSLLHDQMSSVISHSPTALPEGYCYLKPTFQTTSPLDGCPIIFIPCSKSNFLRVGSIVYGLPRIAQAFAVWSVSSRLRMPLLLSP